MKFRAICRLRRPLRKSADGLDGGAIRDAGMSRSTGELGIGWMAVREAVFGRLHEVFAKGLDLNGQRLRQLTAPIASTPNCDKSTRILPRQRHAIWQRDRAPRRRVSRGFVS